ncbi:MAG: transposase [Elusimicrobiota bacterium]|jgi:REP element-mobilizing transposase RayT
MPRKPRPRFPGAVYHAIARGNAGRTIFFDQTDWLFFLDLLRDIKRRTGLQLFSHCLMPNHVHLLIQTFHVDISAIMGSLLNCYARHINSKLNQTGHVFQERFQSPLCEDDAYLMRIARYIHLNPVRAGLVVNPSDWPYSSHRAYLGSALPDISNPFPILNLLDKDITLAQREFSLYVEEGIRQPAEILSDLLPPKNILSEQEGASTEIQTSQDVLPPPTLEEISLACAKQGGIPVASLRGPGRLRPASRSRREFFRKAYSHGYTLTEIAAHLNVSVSAASQALRMP